MNKRPSSAFILSWLLSGIMLLLTIVGNAQSGSLHSTCDSALLVASTGNAQWQNTSFEEGQNGKFFWIKFQANSSQVVFEMDSSILNAAQIQNTTLNGGGVLPKS